MFPSFVPYRGVCLWWRRGGVSQASHRSDALVPGWERPRPVFSHFADFFFGYIVFIVPRKLPMLICKCKQLNHCWFRAAVLISTPLLPSRHPLTPKHSAPWYSPCIVTFTHPGVCSYRTGGDIANAFKAGNAKSVSAPHTTEHSHTNARTHIQSQTYAQSSTHARTTGMHGQRICLRIPRLHDSGRWHQCRNSEMHHPRNRISPQMVQSTFGLSIVT